MKEKAFFLFLLNFFILSNYAFALSNKRTCSLFLKQKNENEIEIIMENKGETGFYIIWDLNFLHFITINKRGKQSEVKMTNMFNNQSSCFNLIFLAPHMRIRQKVKLLHRKLKNANYKFPVIVLKKNIEVKLKYSVPEKLLNSYKSQFETKLKGVLYYHPWTTVQSLESNTIILK